MLDSYENIVYSQKELKIENEELRIKNQKQKPKSKAKVKSKIPMSNSFPQVLMHSAPSLYEHLDSFAQMVESAVQIAGASEDEQVDLMVAVMEALNNAIGHGNGEDASKKVHLKIDIQPASITVWVQDEGRGFDPDDAPDPLAPENIMNDSGRGLLMMRAFMDEVDFMPSQKGTLVKMIKYFSSESPPSHG